MNRKKHIFRWNKIKMKKFELFHCLFIILYWKFNFADFADLQANIEFVVFANFLEEDQA